MTGLNLFVRALAIAAVPVLWYGTAFAGVSSVPELDPGMIAGGIALVASCGLLLIERYRRR